MEIKSLTKTYGERTALAPCSAVFPDGETTCVMGPSGCGKTTLLRLLMGLEPPTGGEILGVPQKKAAVFQEDRLCDGFSAVENIRLVTGRTVETAVILTHLTELGLADSVRQPVRELSGGMRRRVAIARAILFGGDVLFLDEPFKGLDEENRQAVMDYMKRYTAGKTVVLVTHDETEAACFGGRIVRI